MQQNWKADDYRESSVLAETNNSPETASIRVLRRRRDSIT